MTWPLPTYDEGPESRSRGRKMAKRKTTVTLPAAAGTGSARVVLDGDTIVCRRVEEPAAEVGPPLTLRTMPNPLDEARRRGRITQEQFAAAERFRRLHAATVAPGLRAGSLVPRITQTQRRVQGAPTSPTKRWHLACEALKDGSSALTVQLVTLVVIQELPASRAAELLGIQPRRGIDMLRRALDLLAAHYELSEA